MQLFYNMVTLDEDPTGIKMMENPTKNLRVFFFPRRCLKDFLTMQESQKAGVYVLYGDVPNDNLPHIYIGQSGAGVGSHLSWIETNFSARSIIDKVEALGQIFGEQAVSFVYPSDDDN